MPTFIADLAKFCRARHGRVTQLADYLGVAQPHVSAWLSGRQEPSGEHTLRIQAWLARESAAGPKVTMRTRRGEKVGPKRAPQVEEEAAPIWLL